MNPKFERLKEACAARPHGTRQRYIGGCKCVPCRAANSRYESERQHAKRNGDWNGIVDAAPAREHIQQLSRQGVGRHSVAAASDVPDSILWGIVTGTRPRCRARTLRKILAVDEGARAGNARVDPGPAWSMLDELIDRGYSKAQLAKWMGLKMPAIQLRRDTPISLRSAVRVEQLYLKVNAGLLVRP
jgi:hypothetical protein